MILGSLVHKYKQWIHFITVKPAFLRTEEKYIDQKTADSEMWQVSIRQSTSQRWHIKLEEHQSRDLTLKCYRVSWIQIVGNEVLITFSETKTWAFQEFQFKESFQVVKSHIIEVLHIDKISHIQYYFMPFLFQMPHDPLISICS